MRIVSPHPRLYFVSTLGVAHSPAGLAFVAYWGIVLFGYDTSALFLGSLRRVKRTDMGYAEALEEAS